MKDIDVNTVWLDLNEELYRFVLKKVKDEQTAKDIHQGVFVKVQTKIHQLKHTSKLTSWVYQITRNIIIDYFRKKTNKNIAIEGIDIPETESNNFEYADLSNCINSKIAQLSAEHKEVIILTSFKNYSQKELAEHLKISYSGTKSRVQKAREILKDNIIDCPSVESDKSGKLIDFDNSED
ncbi:sigma-70 family RNA polymerase sigma factor [Zobellia sp.]|nr:sigma-70 family RNA polymerase sigma factor [Zobellia sp.]